MQTIFGVTVELSGDRGTDFVMVLADDEAEARELALSMYAPEAVERIAEVLDPAELLWEQYDGIAVLTNVTSADM